MSTFEHVVRRDAGAKVDGLHVGRGAGDRARVLGVGLETELEVSVLK